MSEWEKVGEVGVDTGRIAIVDPCNFDALSYDDWEIGSPSSIVLNGLRVGEVVESGIGDGIYDVEVRYEDVEGWGRRVAEVRVRFLPYEMKGRGLLTAGGGS